MSAEHTPPAPARIRVALVIADLERAGAETQVVHLASTLDRAAFEPRIVLIKSRNDFTDELREGGIPVTALGRRGPADVHVLARLLATLREFRPQVVHAHLSMPTLYAFAAARWARVPVFVATQHSSYDKTMPGWERRIIRAVNRRTDRVVVVSRAAFDEEVAAGVPRERLVAIPNGVPLLPDTADRAALGLPEGLLVLAVGQHHEVKGHRFLLEAWLQVVRAAPAAHLALLGDGPLRPVLEAQARALGLEASVRFLGFRVPSEPYLSACDVLVQPSLSEGLPMAVLEALSAAKPVVASRVGGIAEAVEDGVSGLLVPPADPPLLASAILTLACDPDLRKAMGQAGRARMQREYSTAGVTRRTEALYRELLDARTAPRT